MRAVVLLLALLSLTPAAHGRGQDAVASDDLAALRREHERCGKRIARLAPSIDARGRKLRERVLAAWEAARQDALAVIFDTTLYPDADHGRAGQPLVDEKVAVVRAIGPELDALLRRDLAAVCALSPADARELLALALRLEERAAARASEAALEPFSPVGLRLLAARAGAAPSGERGASEVEGERAALPAWERLVAQRARDVTVMQGNAELLRARPAAGRAPDRDELELARHLDEYRLLMGRPALVLDPRLVESARCHAQDMERLGFFAHESPVPGRESAAQRMQAAGYPAPAGENIAKGQGAPKAAHDDWYRSSGHHRNMLDAAFVAVGTGRAGPHWVQNFGS